MKSASVCLGTGAAIWTIERRGARIELIFLWYACVAVLVDVCVLVGVTHCIVQHLTVSA